MSASLPFTVMPCPCCGSMKVAISTTTNALTNLPRNDKPVCLECGVRAETLEAWNKRTTRPEVAQLTDAERFQMKDADHMIASSGEWMVNKIETDLASTHSSDFDRVHRLRHSLRDLYKIVTKRFVPSPLARREESK